MGREWEMERKSERSQRESDSENERWDETNGIEEKRERVTGCRHEKSDKAKQREEMRESLLWDLTLFHVEW